MSTNKINVLKAFLWLGASDLTLFVLYQLVDFRSALMVSETSASEIPGASKNVCEAANPHHVPAVRERWEARRARIQFEKKPLSGQGSWLTVRVESPRKGW